MAEIPLRRLLNCCAKASVELDGMEITYRTYDPYGRDTYAGACKYYDGKLIPLDHDNYSLDDLITDYQMSHNEKENRWDLTVWYKSKWTTEE